MEYHQNIASLDIGTTSIKMIVADYYEGQMQIIASNQERIPHFNRHQSYDPRILQQTISKLLKKVERQAMRRIDQVVVNIPDAKPKLSIETYSISTSDMDTEITGRHLRLLAEKIQTQVNSFDRTVTRIIPLTFDLDGFSQIDDPLGMHGQDLTIKALVVTSKRDLVYNIEEAVEAAGLTIGDRMIDSLAIAKHVSNEDQRQKGWISIDIGGQRTTAAVFHEDLLKFVASTSQAGHHLTSDIGQVLDIDYRLAEALKIREAAACPDRIQVKEDIYLTETMEDPVSNQLLAEIVEARLEQIFLELKNDLDQIGALQLPEGITLSGPTAMLAGIKDLAEKIFKCRVRIHTQQAAYTTALGLLDGYHQQSELEFNLNQQLLRSTPSPSPQEIDMKDVKTQYINQDEESLKDKMLRIFASFFGEE